MPNLGFPDLIILAWVIIAVLIVVGIVWFLRGPRKQQTASPPGAPPSWLADPTLRHQYRYWNGAQWTPDVSDDGVQSSDPL